MGKEKIVIVLADSEGSPAGVADLSLDGHKVILLNSVENYDAPADTDPYEDEDNPYNFSYRTVDPRNFDELKKFWTETEAKFGPIRIFINNFEAHTEPTDAGVKKNMQNRAVRKNALALFKGDPQTRSLFVNMTSSWAILDSTQKTREELAAKNILYVNIDLRTTPDENFMIDDNGSVLISENMTAHFTGRLLNDFIYDCYVPVDSYDILGSSIKSTIEYRQLCAHSDHHQTPFVCINSKTRGISLPIEQPDEELIVAVGDLVVDIPQIHEKCNLAIGDLLAKNPQICEKYTLKASHDFDEEALWDIILETKQYISYLILKKEDGNEDKIIKFFKDATPNDKTATAIIIGDNGDDEELENVTIKHFTTIKDVMNFLNS